MRATPIAEYLCDMIRRVGVQYAYAHDSEEAI